MPDEIALVVPSEHDSQELDMFAWLRERLPSHRREIERRRQLELQLEEDLHALRVLILS